MEKIITIFTLIFINTISIFSVKAAAEDMSKENYDITMKQDILSLMLAYPEYISGVSKNNDKVYLIMKSGKKILYDDKKNKNFEEKLNNPDLQDMLEQTYPLGAVTSLMDKNYDPGRLRVYELTRDVYGASRAQIEKNLTMVNTGYGVFQFNKNNKAAESLKNVFKELVPMAKQNRKVAAFLAPCRGTYNYRMISGTGRLSPHSFGTAIDLASDKSDYWKWATREQGEKRLLSYSKEVVEVFEKHNFIWGGKWGHFDILHFEYRPEIVIKARIKNKSSEANKPWYEGAEIEGNNIKDIIEKIEEGLK